jgi:hypothetical protein
LGESFYNWFNSGGDELMKKMKLIIAAVAMVGLVSSSIASADGFAPGEGLYLGGFVGTGSGVVQPKVVTTTHTVQNRTETGGTFEATEGGLGLFGIEGGGTIGYGYKISDFYIGLEGEIATGDVEFKLTSSTPIDITPSNNCASACQEGSVEDVTEVSAKKDWTGGMFGRLGVYINPSTLISARGGVLVTKFDVAYTGQSETFYGGGPSVGIDMESQITAIDPNLSFRIGVVYTDYLTAPVSGIGTDIGDGSDDGNIEVTGSAMSARVGLQYSFFDVNSLF